MGQRAHSISAQLSCRVHKVTVSEQFRATNPCGTKDEAGLYRELNRDAFYGALYDLRAMTKWEYMRNVTNSIRQSVDYSDRGPLLVRPCMLSLTVP
jgi:hypothetical protein